MLPGWGPEGCRPGRMPLIAEPPCPGRAGWWRHKPRSSCTVASLLVVKYPFRYLFGRIPLVGYHLARVGR